MDKRYQVFVSSTYADLKSERDEVIRTLMEMDCMPAVMEAFPAVDNEQMEFIKTIIDDSDYYVLIIGGRYGSVDDEGISFTEREYDYAVEKKIPILAFVNNDFGSLFADQTDQNSALKKKLDKFKKKVCTGRIVKMWAEPNELSGALALSLNKAMKLFPATGWIRADTAAQNDILSEINELRKENKSLSQKIRATSNSNDITVDFKPAEIFEKIVVSGKYFHNRQTRNFLRQPKLL